MIPPSTSDQQSYKNHLIVVRSRRLGPQAWAYTVDIQTPEGNWLPPITDRDDTSEDSESALAEGMRVGMEQVDRQH